MNINFQIPDGIVKNGELYVIAYKNPTIKVSTCKQCDFYKHCINWGNPHADFNICPIGTFINNTKGTYILQKVNNMYYQKL